MHKNNEGYADPTAGKAIKSSARMPTHIYNVYSVINNVAGLHGLEIIGLRDKKEKPLSHRQGCQHIYTTSILLSTTWPGSTG